MIIASITHSQWTLPILIFFVRGISPENVFPNITSITTRHPIINATMYEVYPNLWNLDLSNQTGFEFPVGQVLLVHDRLCRFACNNCGVHSIYRISLLKLPELRQLKMEYNELQYIHPDAFEHNTLLENVYLAGNKLSTLNPEATLRHIPSLMILDLSWNEQFSLNKVEVQAPRLLIFTCNHCHTTYFDRNTLAHMRKISRLYLAYNGMERIDDDALSEAKNLKTFVVDGNRDLRRLNLSSESLKILSAERCSLERTLTTSNMPMLRTINVRANNLSQVDEYAFLQNPNISVILLDDNEIEKLPNSLLELPLHRLQQLCLDRNPLQPCPEADRAKKEYNLKNLRHGCMDDDNDFYKFESYLPSIVGTAVYRKTPVHNFSIDRLTVDLSDRAIVYIEPDYLSDVKEVEVVLFDDNHLFDFQHSRIFMKSSSVERIYLRNCSITEVYESTFKELPSLNHLDLQGNKIQSIRSSFLFANNPNLKYLNLSHNNLDFIAANAFQSLKHLEDLHLDWNERLANNAEGPFLLSSSLRTLSCRHCRFERLNDKTLHGLPNLSKLYLEHNYIDTLHADALQGTPNLSYLSLQHNHLVIFEPNIAHLPHLQTLCLAGNPHFDFEHHKNQALGEYFYKKRKLDSECQEDDFAHKLKRGYILRKNDAKPLANMKRAPLMDSDTSSAVSCTANNAIGVLGSLLFYSVVVIKRYVH